MHWRVETIELITTPWRPLALERMNRYTWIKKHFREADTDGNGVLSFGECLEILRKHPSILSKVSLDLDAFAQSALRPSHEPA